MRFLTGSGVTMLIIYADYLAPIITKIFNNSIKQQKVPRVWKLANVTPIPKVSPLSVCSQLRPISLTNVIMRIFERVIYKQEISTILQSSIGPNQFAYKRGHNTTMALLKCQHYWLKNGWIKMQTLLGCILSILARLLILFLTRLYVISSSHITSTLMLLTG